MTETIVSSPELEAQWQGLRCNFEQVKAVFPDCMQEANALLSADGVVTYLEQASLLSRMGRGADPVLIYLEESPSIAALVGEEVLPEIRDFANYLSTHTNFKAIAPFLQSLGAVSRRLHSLQQLRMYMALLKDMVERTSGSIHGHHTTFPSPGLPDLLEQAPRLLSELCLEGFRNWVDYGIKYYNNHPERQKDYFSMQSADANAVFQRERHGTLMVDHERELDLYLYALWEDTEVLIPYSNAFDELRQPMPYYDAMGIRLPDVYDDEHGVSGMDRYRATLAHIAAHRRWTTQIVADNLSPFQRMAVEFFEDIRVDHLAIQLYPGLHKMFMALHPVPMEDGCDPDKQSAVRLRLAMVSRAMLDADYTYKNPDVLDVVQQFKTLLAAGDASTQEIVSLAVSFIARTRRQADLAPDIYFENTEVSYRDDNRHMWVFIEEGDEEEMFDLHPKTESEDNVSALPPRHYREWDYSNHHYRPDWVSVYEAIHPSGNPSDIDRLLDKHAALAKRLKQILDMLKPQQYVRVRYQEDGSELDLDVAIRSLIDLKSGSQPDPRINMSHKHDGRDIAVTLLLDLSQSLNEKVAGCNQTILELSQEAVSLLSWAIEQLGDKFSIGGFHSNTRHDVRFMHIKGFGEHWGDDVKARLAAMEACYSTRMGAAMRHAAHYLHGQKADKKLLLVLTDGEPADIDVHDHQLLIQDANQAVKELSSDGIYSYCINLDPKADAYVSDIFGKQYTIIDHVDRLPEKLPQIFMSLTK